MSEEEKKKEMKHKMEAMWEAAAAAYSNWVIDNHMVLGLYSEFESFLAPELKGRDGVRILDVASASGEPAVTLATALPRAECVSTDLAHAYLALGKARAAKLGLGNICFETADAEDLHRYSNASFDAVTCSLGLMFMPNHAEALREFCRVLKPGGLMAASVWRTQEHNPLFRVAAELTAEYDPSVLASAAPSLGVRFGDPAGLLADLATAGMGDVQCKELQVEFQMPEHMWWKGMVEMPLAIKAALTKAQEARPGDDVFEEARLKMQQMLVAGGWLNEQEALSMQASCWFVTARKPA